MQKTEIKNSTEITKIQKRINFFIWVFCILILIGVSMQWYLLTKSMKNKNNFKHEKTRTYNSMHGLKENN